MSKIRNAHRIVKVLAYYLIVFSTVHFVACEPKLIESNDVETMYVDVKDITSTAVVLRGSTIRKSSEVADVGFIIDESLSKVDSCKGIYVNVMDTLITEPKVEFTASVSDLFVNTKYYYRAWVKLKNDSLFYGSVKSFETKSILSYSQGSPSYYCPKEFSVSDSSKVYFSVGNLQYHVLKNKWRFAENQLYYLGIENSQIFTTNDCWIDLFAWSTYNGSIQHTLNFGVEISVNLNDYLGEFVDWGINPIHNDATGEHWRTLTSSEWNYLLFERKDHEILLGTACVDSINGLILLPDTWTLPQDIAFKTGFATESDAMHYRKHQYYSLDQWQEMEKAGAVFLPAAGYRYAKQESNGITQEVNTKSIQTYGYYFSSTEYEQSDKYVKYLYFGSDNAQIVTNYKNYGHSVRLVRDKH